MLGSNGNIQSRLWVHEEDFVNDLKKANLIVNLQFDRDEPRMACVQRNMLLKWLKKKNECADAKEGRLSPSSILTDLQASGWISPPWKRDGSNSMVELRNSYMCVYNDTALI
jgi:hypothetical protein